MMQVLMGHSAGEVAEASGPKGPVEYEVLALFASWDDVPANLKTV
jgi:transcription elongation GreA/GreB family factor